MPSKKSAVPLMWRVPNAPATFVGRRDELRAIKAAVKRGPLVVLCGPGGLGKTALASAAVRDVLPERAPRAVMVSVRAPSPFRQTLVDVVRALGHVEPREGADLAMLAIDLAEARGALVVLDDLHHALPEATEMLVTIARYSRRAVWIVTSRVAPSAPELVGQIVNLAALGDKHLATLARLVDPKMKPANAARIAKEAEGSPWRARQLAGELPHEQVDETSRALVAALSVVERPISAAALAATVSSEGKIQHTVDDLVRRGLVEAVAGGYRLHEAARPWIATWMPDHAPASSRTIAALAAGGDADAIEALRLALKQGATERALEICRASFDAMLHAGHATTLWKLVSACEGAEWSSFKLRAAMQLAEVRITALLDEPPADALRDRLLWVRALLVEGSAAEAVSAAISLREAAARSGDERIEFWATLEHAMASRVHVGPERGLELLDALRPIDDATRALRAALSAFWLAEVGRIDESIRTLERSERKRDDALTTPLADEILGGPLDFFVRYYRMAAFMECGHLERAHAQLTAGGGELDIDDQLRASYVQLDGIANLSIARGKLDEAGKILERLLRGPQQSSTYHLIARLLDVERRIAAGAFASVTRDLDELLSNTRVNNPLVHAWCIDTHERLGVIQATPDDRALNLEASPVGSVARSILALRRAFRSARWGTLHEVPAAIDVEGSIVREMVLAVDALVAGTDAHAFAERAVNLAASHGWGVRECEARELLVESLIARGNHRRALTEARTLSKRALAMPSPRFDLEARCLVALVEDPPLDFATLEEIAMAGDTAPCAARRARAMLGDASARLDSVDERVIAGARELATSTEVFRLRATDVHTRGWGLDVRRGVVWLPDGRRVSFARHALLSHVLEVLARHGGVASFEDLAREVWQRRTFHPLNDGNRIRVTLHRLRALVEDDPQKPERIVLGGSSYTLGGEPFTLICNAK